MPTIELHAPGVPSPITVPSPEVREPRPTVAEAEACNLIIGLLSTIGTTNARVTFLGLMVEYQPVTGAGSVNGSVTLRGREPLGVASPLNA